MPEAVVRCIGTRGDGVANRVEWADDPDCRTSGRVVVLRAGGGVPGNCGSNVAAKEGRAPSGTDRSFFHWSCGVDAAGHRHGRDAGIRTACHGLEVINGRLPLDGGFGRFVVGLRRSLLLPIRGWHGACGGSRLRRGAQAVDMDGGVLDFCGSGGDSLGYGGGDRRSVRGGDEVIRVQAAAAGLLMIALIAGTVSDVPAARPVRVMGGYQVLTA